MKKLLIGLLGVGGFYWSCAIHEDRMESLVNDETEGSPGKPRLVVQIMVDQMRPDYLDRFRKALLHDAEGREIGMLRLKSEGVWFTNARTAGAPSVTAAGHASVCTGASPSKHGIVANAMFDSETERFIEAASDSSVSLVRTPGVVGGDPLSRVHVKGSSPRKLRTENFADALRTRMLGKSKAVAVSIKDRGAVFCGGSKATGAYWYDSKSGTMASSTHFVEELPKWVNSFNKKNSADLNQAWTPLYTKAEYKSFLEGSKFADALDVRSYISKRFGGGFPIVLNDEEMSKVQGYEMFKRTPFASQMLVDFALQAVSKEKLGRGDGVDFLHVSFSAPDTVGHLYGPESIELIDTYVRLNRQIESLMRGVVRRVGKDKTLFVLTADHGVQHMPEVSRSFGQESGRLNSTELKNRVKAALAAEFGEGKWVRDYQTDQIYLNESVFAENGVDLERGIEIAQEAAEQQEGVQTTLSRADVQFGFNDLAENLKRGFDEERSGHVFVIGKPGWLSTRGMAGNHGSVHPDDLGIPLAFFGWGVPKGKVVETPARADDIAPTILDMLGLSSGGDMTGISRANELR